MSGDKQGIFDAENDGEKPADLNPPRQRGMQVDSAKYYELGAAQVGVGADGMPVMGGEKPVGPEVGITAKNLVCIEAPGRPQCGHYCAIVLPAEGVAHGFGELRQIRRFCKQLSTAVELFEISGAIYGCSARSPRDEESSRVITDFEQRQREAAEEQAEENIKVDL